MNPGPHPYQLAVAAVTEHRHTRSPSHTLTAEHIVGPEDHCGHRDDSYLMVGLLALTDDLLAQLAHASGQRPDDILRAHALDAARRILAAGT